MCIQYKKKSMKCFLAAVSKPAQLPLSLFKCLCLSSEVYNSTLGYNVQIWKRVTWDPQKKSGIVRRWRPPMGSNGPIVNCTISDPRSIFLCSHMLQLNQYYIAALVLLNISSNFFYTLTLFETKFWTNFYWLLAPDLHYIFDY